MWRLLLVSICQLALALFPGREPDEGDIRHLYPLTTVAIGLHDHAHMLPYTLGWLENLDYPKPRIHLLLYVMGKEDTTKDQVMWWKGAVGGLFASVNIEYEADNWMETALRAARLKKTKRCLLMTGNTLPANGRMIQDLAKDDKKIVVSTLLSPAVEGEPPNILLEQREEEEGVVEMKDCVQITEVVFPMMIQLDAIDSSYLTFDAQNLPNYEGSSDPEDVFLQSANRMNISLWLENGSFHGVHFLKGMELNEQRRALRYYLSDLVADDKLQPVTSRSVRPWTEDKELWGVDKIFVINLKRRTSRMRRMTKIFDILGVDYTVIEATDGKDLSSSPAYTIFPNYEDPFHKRPIKAGEIGCFLSHYRIWKQVVDEGIKRVIIFEDDLRFSMLGLERLRETLEDLDNSRKEWDLIYLGRKKQAQDQEDLWVPEHRHLSTVGYSYWTLGYMLSQSGAQRLLAPQPLQKLLPVDEYLPIMYDKHTNEEWMSHFPVRNLRAFTLYPLVVSPQCYTNQLCHISDTEDSVILEDPKTPNPKDEL